MTENTLSIEMQEITKKHISGNGRQKLFSFIKRKISDDSVAEDILQDVFYQLLNTLQSGPIEQISSWLYRAAEHKVIDWFRKKKSVSLDKINEGKSFDFEEEGSDYHLEDILFDLEETSERIYDREALWLKLAEALEELPEEQRQVFVMQELDGKSYKEIEAELNIPVNTLLSRKRYAILFLRKRLKKIYNEHLNNN